MQHFEALEADLFRCYGLDLPAAVWGDDPISARRLRVFVEGLPLDGAFGVAVGARRAPGWGYGEELLAALVELVDASNCLFVAAHTESNAERPMPARVWRPGEPDPQMRTESAVAGGIELPEPEPPSLGGPRRGRKPVDVAALRKAVEMGGTVRVKGG